MKELIEQVIWLGNYDLVQLLETIDRYHVEGRLTNEERQELYMAARKGAKPGVITDALYVCNESGEKTREWEELYR